MHEYEDLAQNLVALGFDSFFVADDICTASGKRARFKR